MDPLATGPRNSSDGRRLRNHKQTFVTSFMYLYNPVILESDKILTEMWQVSVRDCLSQSVTALAVLAPISDAGLCAC